MTREQAASLVKQLLGSYLALNAHDPETYLAGLVELFSGYPIWAGQRVVVANTSKWPPTRSELLPLLEEQVRVHRAGADWDRKARRLALPAPERPRPTREQIDETLRRHGLEHMTAGARDQSLRAAAERTLADLCTSVGVSMDDLPDAPERDRC